MKYRKVTAIIPTISLNDVEHALMEIAVPGMTVTKARGMGEYRNYYAKDSMTDSSRVEVFIKEENAQEVADTIAKAVHQGMNTDGVIAIMPVDDFMHIREYGNKKNDE